MHLPRRCTSVHSCSKTNEKDIFILSPHIFILDINPSMKHEVTVDKTLQSCTLLCDANGIYISFLDIFTHVLYQFVTMLQNSLRGNSPSLNEVNHYKTILL